MFGTQYTHKDNGKGKGKFHTKAGNENQAESVGLTIVFL